MITPAANARTPANSTISPIFCLLHDALTRRLLPISPSPLPKDQLAHKAARNIPDNARRLAISFRIRIPEGPRSERFQRIQLRRIGALLARLEEFLPCSYRICCIKDCV